MPPHRFDGIDTQPLHFAYLRHHLSRGVLACCAVHPGHRGGQPCQAQMPRHANQILPEARYAIKVARRLQLGQPGQPVGQLDRNRPVSPPLKGL